MSQPFYGPVYAPTQPPVHNRSPTRTSSSSISYSAGHHPSAYSTTTLPPLPHPPPLPYPGDQSANDRQAPHASHGYHSVSSGNAGAYMAYASQYSAQPNNGNAYAHTPRTLPANSRQAYLGSSDMEQSPYSNAGAFSSRLADIRSADTRPMLSASLAGKTSGPSVPRLSTQSATHSMAEDIEPMHVVGSQGRRGILPSASGKPVATAESGNSKGPNAGLKKDTHDGKWPCEFCNKRYLHAKHLKRHLLRRKLSICNVNDLN